MITRAILKRLTKRADFKKAIILFGPRQVGKTTLAKALAENMKQDFEYFS